jgi:DNA-binding transcriptional MerR regulator
MVLNKRETWSDWFPKHVPTLLLDDFLEAVKSNGADCDVETLRYWQKEHILPPPERRWLSHALCVRAIYPYIAAQFVVRIRDWQRSGMNLNEIRNRVSALRGVESLDSLGTCPCCGGSGLTVLDSLSDDDDRRAW